MQAAAGNVVDGKVVVVGASIIAGALLAVIARGWDEGFLLGAEQEDALLAAMAEIDRGEYVELDELLRRSRSRVGCGPSGQGLRSSRTTGP